MAEAVAEQRADKVAKSEAKVLAYAEYAGWNDATTDRVMQLIGGAHSDVDALLSDVTSGDRTWAEVKPEVRQVRVEQAQAIRDELGDEAFRDFARALHKTSRRFGGRPGGRAARRGGRPQR